MCLFGKVLRNEVDEDFRFVQAALRDTVYTLLKQQVREKYPLKGEVELKALSEEISSDRIPIEVAQWSKIVERMYNQEDIQFLEVKIRENALIHSRMEV